MIPSLDGWRAVAILIVAISHAGFGHLIPGGMGVNIFFFLSGYLITTLIINEYQKVGHLSIYNFYLRRFFRLMPPLTITLILIYGLTYSGLLKGGISLDGFFAQLLYLANYYWIIIDPATPRPEGSGIFWSLAVEEHFYLVFPILFAALIKQKTLKQFGLILAGTAVLALAWRFVLVVYFDSIPERTYYATDTRFDSIIFGCLLSIFKNPIHETAKQQLNMKDWGILSTAVIALVFSLLYRNDVFRETLRYSIQGIVLAPLFYYSILHAKHWAFKGLNNAFVMHLGKISYSMYLIHFVLLVNLAEMTSNRFLNIAIAFLATYLYAFLIDRYVDQPVHQFKKKFRPKGLKLLSPNNNSDKLVRS